jgi:hypothetical protein
MRFAANAALLIMKSMIGAREVNATRQNKRFLIEPMRLRRINSSKRRLAATEVFLRRWSVRSGRFGRQ